MGFDDEKTNGVVVPCPVGADWNRFRLEFEQATKELHGSMDMLLANTGHLKKLPELNDGIAALNIVMQEIKENLIAPATGKNQVPTDTVNKLLDQQNSNARYIYYILGFVITALVVTLGILLVGERYNWINPLEKHYPTRISDVSFIKC